MKFRKPPVWMFTPLGSPDVHRNTLRLTIQPDEGFALYFHIKAPGKPLKLERLPLDFFYKERFQELPEAYQTLLLDVMEGDQTLFVHADEVEAAWRLFTPILDNTLAVSFYAGGHVGTEGVRRADAAQRAEVVESGMRRRRESGIGNRTGTDETVASRSPSRSLTSRR